MKKITILLRENLNPKEFPSKLGWKRIESSSASEDINYPDDEPDFIEQDLSSFNFSSFKNIKHVHLSVINMVPVSSGSGALNTDIENGQGDDGDNKNSPGQIYEEYLLDEEINLNVLVGFNRMKRHIGPNRSVNFGFVGIDQEQNQANILFVSINGDEPRLFVRTLSL